MLLDGWHLLGEAANANVVVEKIAICGPPTAKEPIIVDRLRRNGALIVEVTGSVLNAVSPVNSTTPVGEFTGDTAFSTEPVTSTMRAPLRRRRSTMIGSFAVGGPQIAIFSTTTLAFAASPSRCQPSSSINGPAPRASSRNSLTMGC